MQDFEAFGVSAEPAACETPERFRLPVQKPRQQGKDLAGLGPLLAGEGRNALPGRSRCAGLFAINPPGQFPAAGNWKARGFEEQLGESLTPVAWRREVQGTEKIGLANGRKPHAQGKSSPPMTHDRDVAAHFRIREVPLGANPGVTAVTTGLAQQVFVVDPDVSRRFAGPAGPAAFVARCESSQDVRRFLLHSGTSPPRG